MEYRNSHLYVSHQLGGGRLMGSLPHSLLSNGSPPSATTHPSSRLLNSIGGGLPRLGGISSRRITPLRAHPYSTFTPYTSEGVQRQRIRRAGVAKRWLCPGGHQHHSSTNKWCPEFDSRRGLRGNPTRQSRSKEKEPGIESTEGAQRAPLTSRAWLD